MRPAKIHSLNSTGGRGKNICIYSDPGVGKTVLAASSPKAVILNSDRADALDSARDFGYNPDELRVSGSKDLWDIYLHLKNDKHGYEWCWLDSGTLYQELHMEQIMRILHQRAKHRDIDLPDKAEYQKEQREFMRWIRHMTMLPINFGVTAHIMRIVDFDEDGEEVVHYRPAFQGKQGELSSKLCGYMSIVGRLHVAREEVDGRKKSVRVLQMQPDRKFYAKGTKALGAKLIEPTIPEIMRLSGTRRTTTRRRQSASRQV
jgi:hypothetical protein